MHILLVDNYDSFTYNLFHQLAGVTGREPTVLRNDVRVPDLSAYDAIVISPGPGTAERPGDFGTCREIIARARQPLLGVCLGHQGLALAHGGRVGRAPEPWHGRLSPVLHDERELFAGIPSPFQVVRYHSLAVTALPPGLAATAITPDGVVMAMRHRTRPQWGVQFHPESIATEHGNRIVHNFVSRVRPSVRLSRRELPAAPPRPTAPNGLRVVHASLPTAWSGEVVYDRLFRGSKHSVWLDGEAGRFSILADDSGPLARTAYADAWTGRVRVESAAGARVVQSGFLDWLDADLRAHAVPQPPLPCDFALGWLGYLGYELKAECGGERAHRSPEPDAAMLFADRAVVLDHALGQTHLLALAAPGDEAAARAWLARTGAALLPLAGVAPDPPSWTTPGGAPELRHDRGRYEAMIERCRELIAAGETYEVCLTNSATAPVRLGPEGVWAAYRELRRFSPAPYAALLRFGGLSVLSSSPERFLRVDRDRTVESKPIKGTRPRGATPHADELLRKDLVASEKDRAENLMIVDLVRNDLGRVARAGTVRVPALFDVETYTTVHQLVSTVQAELRPGASAVDCVRAAFPGGSMTGAPKLRTMRIIDALEAGPRGVYSGAIGWFSLSGAADLSIAIRTVVATPSRIRYGTGGAVVALSDAAAEYEETAVKAAPLLHLLDTEFPGRA